MPDIECAFVSHAHTFQSGANAQVTLAENRDAFDRLRLRPRILRPVGAVDTRCTLVGGVVLAAPIALAPTAMHKMAHADGELASVRAAHAEGALFTLSSLSTTSLEEVAQAAPDAVRWFQLYIYKDRELTRQVVKRAEQAGYRAIVLTVDTPFLGKREADVRHKFKLPAHLQLANFAPRADQATRVNTSEGGSSLQEYFVSLIDADLSWEHVKWLRSVTKLPVILKGVLTAEDARLSVEAGVDGIVVSNHGARQLDHSPATIEALPEVVDAVRGRIPVYLDGGVRRGTDVLKALAIGAACVFVGRPVLYGLQCGGEAGVRRVLQLLQEELKLAMALAGVAKLSDINRTLVTHASSYFSKL